MQNYCIIKQPDTIKTKKPLKVISQSKQLAQKKSKKKQGDLVRLSAKSKSPLFFPFTRSFTGLER